MKIFPCYHFFLVIFKTNVALYGIGIDENFFETSDYGTVSTLAKLYITLIKSIQRLGPYYLGKFDIYI